MKCPHCGQEHPDNFTFCPVTGKKIQIDSPALLACTNSGCPIYRQRILPADSRFCPECGYPIAGAAGGSASGSSAFGASGSGGSAIEEFTVGDVTFKMIRVEGGTFTMGQNPWDDEKPPHDVTLDGFYIGETQVTQALWKEVVGTNPSHFAGDIHPVECVSWNECRIFTSKLNARTGKLFRLPTEAEWEFAARGGIKSKGYKYSGSDKINEVAWYEENSGGETQPVAQKKPNELGLYDMSGNVWEWCLDWDGGFDRVGRGGSWINDACHCSPFDYFIDSPDGRYYVGLRLCLSE